MGRVLFWTGIVSYPAARVDHRFKDGDTVRLGPTALTAHITGGHTSGCTSWSFTVRDGNRDLDVVSAHSLRTRLSVLRRGSARAASAGESVALGGLKASGYRPQDSEA